MAALSFLPVFVMACFCIIQCPIEVYGRHIPRKHHKDLPKQHASPLKKALVPFAAKRQYDGSFKIDDGAVIGAGIYQMNPEGVMTVDIKLHIKPENKPMISMPTSRVPTSRATTVAPTTAVATTAKDLGSTSVKASGPTPPKHTGPTTAKDLGSSTAKPTGPTKPKASGPSTPKHTGPTTAKDLGSSTAKPTGPTKPKASGPTTPKHTGPTTAKDLGSTTASGPTKPSTAAPSTTPQRASDKPTGASSGSASSAASSSPTGASGPSKGYLKKFDGHSIKASKGNTEMIAKWNGDDIHKMPIGGGENHEKSSKAIHVFKSTEEVKQGSQPEKTNFENKVEIPEAFQKRPENILNVGHSIEIPEAVIPYQEKRPESLPNDGPDNVNLPGNGVTSPFLQNGLSATQVPELNRLKEALSDAASNWVFNLREGKNNYAPVPYTHQNYAPANLGDWRKEYQQWGK